MDMKTNFLGVIIAVFTFFSLPSNSHGFNTITMTPTHLGRNFIRIAAIRPEKDSMHSNIVIEMYMKDNQVVVAKNQSVTIHNNEILLVEGDRIKNVGNEPIKDINTDGGEVFFLPNVKGKVVNSRLEVVKSCEFWKQVLHHCG